MRRVLHIRLDTIQNFLHIFLIKFFFPHSRAFERELYRNQLTVINVCFEFSQHAVRVQSDIQLYIKFRELYEGYIIYCFVQVVTCGSIPLETSFQRTPRCVYASTELDEYKGWGGKSANPSHRCFSWGRRHSEVSFAYIKYCIYRLIWKIELVVTMSVFYFKYHIILL